MPLGKKDTDQPMTTETPPMSTGTDELAAPERPFTRFIASFVRSDLRLDLITDITLDELEASLRVGVVRAWLTPSPQIGVIADRTKWGKHPYIMTASGVEYLQVLDVGTIR